MPIRYRIAAVNDETGEEASDTRGDADTYEEAKLRLREVLAGPPPPPGCSYQIIPEEYEPDDPEAEGGAR